MLEVRLLGQFDLQRDGKPVALPSRAAQSLLAYLLLTAGTSHRREKLAGLLWPDITEENARRNLRQELWRLRRAIETRSPGDKGRPLLKVDELSIGWNSGSQYWLDVMQLQQGIAESISADALIESLSLYRGELLPGFYDELLTLERERVRTVYDRGMARLIELLLSGKRWQDILDWGERWIALGQTPEPAYRALMLAHSAQGNRSQVAAVYERCVRAMREDLGVEPSEQTRRLFEQLSTKPDPANAIETRAGTNPPSQPSRDSNIATMLATPGSSLSRWRSSRLPVPPTSFIGREKELKEIARLLSSSRLLTLTGSGGVGKTRLAIQTAHAAQGEFEDGVFWVDLVSLSDPNLVSQEIAQCLRVREVPNVPLIETLKSDLGAKHALLVLDNCEHLIDIAAHTVEQLLSASPNLKILATSRERLGLFNETVWLVPSLSENTSRLLFAERARAAQHDFVLTSANEAFVGQICARLDGIPLAIELAAARTALLSAEEIARRLDNRFALLTSGSRTALPRHLTLRAMIDWSYDLLNEPERILFRRLSAFAGGFTLEAAEVACSHGGLQRNEVLDLLGRLVDKSLVIVEQGSNLRETRYHLLETIRQYALERLEAIGETSALRDQHLEYYLALAEKTEPKFFHNQSITAFRRIEKDIDNFRAAIEWSTNTGKADVALRILGALVYYWFSHALALSEWYDQVQQALARPEGKKRTLARAAALNGIGLLSWADDYAISRRPELEEALSISRELDDAWNTATALRSLGVLEITEGNYIQARTYLEQSLAIWRQIGHAGETGLAWTSMFLADAALTHRETEWARSLYEESATILRRVGDPDLVAYAVRRQAQLLWSAGESERAFALCQESLRLNFKVSNRRAVIACVAGFAAIAATRHALPEAATLMAAVEGLTECFGIRLLYMDKMEYERNLALLKERLDQKTLAELWSEGKSMTLEQAIAFALRKRTRG